MEKREEFIQCEKRLFESYGFRSEIDGSVVPLSPIDKIIYVVMRDRYDFFVNKQKGKYHESQETTAERAGTFRRKVNETVKMFMEHGVIKGKKEKVGDHVHWVYEEIHPLVLCKKEGDLFLRDKMKAKEKPPVKEAVYSSINDCSIEEDDLPW